VARGGQVIFSSVDLTPGIPKIMRDVPAVLPGGKLTEQTYGDFEDEANQFFNAFMEVMIKGNMKGNGFNFPLSSFILIDSQSSRGMIDPDLHNPYRGRAGESYCPFSESAGHR